MRRAEVTAQVLRRATVARAFPFFKVRWLLGLRDVAGDAFPARSLRLRNGEVVPMRFSAFVPVLLGCLLAVESPAADLGATATAEALPHPWQMRNSTPARTGQSPAVGASQGQLDWKFPIAGTVPQMAVAQDGTIYLGTVFNENAWNNESYAYALDSSGGTLLWRRKVTPYVWGASQATSGGPAVDDAGNVLIPSTNTQLLKLTGDGDSVWVHQGSANAIIQGSPAVLPDQTHPAHDLSRAPDRQGRRRHTLFTGPAFNSGGTVAVAANGEMALGGAAHHEPHTSVDIQYFNADGTLRWQRTSISGAQGMPVFGPDGSVYAPFLATAFFPDGTVKWTTDVYLSTRRALRPRGALLPERRSGGGAGRHRRAGCGR